MTTTLAKASDASNKKIKETIADQDNDSLDLVRNILFGEQAKKTEERRLELEQSFEVSINAFRNETEKRFAGVSKEVSALLSLMEDETKARQAEFSHTQEALSSLTQQLSQLDSKTQQADTQLQKRLEHETRNTNQYIRSVNDDINVKLDNAVSQLRHEKADRKAIAGLLSSVAQQLLESDEQS